MLTKKNLDWIKNSICCSTYVGSGQFRWSVELNRIDLCIYSSICSSSNYSCIYFLQVKSASNMFWLYFNNHRKKYKSHVTPSFFTQKEFWVTLLTLLLKESICLCFVQLCCKKNIHWFIFFMNYDVFYSSVKEILHKCLFIIYLLFSVNKCVNT